MRATLLSVALCACTGGEPAAPAVDGRVEELGRCEGFDPNRSAYFGDTHVHTYLSLDANLQGNRLTPADAYRFARGEEVGVQPYDAAGKPLRKLQLDRPLDFVVLSDHAEFLGLVHACLTPGSAAYDDGVCQRYRDEPDEAFVGLNLNLSIAPAIVQSPAPCREDDGACFDDARAAWVEVQEAAEAAYDRSPACTFTSFVGYEWSGSPGTQNLHRNVVFRNHVVPSLPTSYFDESYEEGLWAALTTQCIDAGAGCDVLTIPHNSNLSAGLMFETTRSDGSPFDEAYARTRAALEPLVEVFQHKGDSECLPGAGAADELCAFEKLPYRNLAAANLGSPEAEPEPVDFVRDALGRGLELARQLGHNPFAYGLIASTDTHLGTPGAVDERAFIGHGGAGLTVRDALPEGLPDRIWFNPGGLAVLWAEESSREALFAAMRRREAYGTSGPRIVLRLFAGWGLPEGWCEEPDVAAAYEGGVPMGGVLPPRPGDAGAPRLIVSALRDPGTAASPGTPLERLQIVKAWLDGETARFAVFDVAGEPDEAAGVDVATCTPTGEGSDSLCTVWTDPAFDPAAPALYYARVFESPSCRWHVYLCNDAGVDCNDEGSVAPGYEGCCEQEPTQRERAWSSPIWYEP